MDTLYLMIHVPGKMARLPDFTTLLAVTSNEVLALGIFSSMFCIEYICALTISMHV